MKVSSSFLHFDHTPALDEKINEASSKMSKFFEDKGSIKWFCYVKNGENFAEVNYVVPHADYHAKASADTMYGSIELALDKIERQAQKQKDKFNKLHRGKVHLEELMEESVERSIDE